MILCVIPYKQGYFSIYDGTLWVGSIIIYCDQYVVVVSEDLSMKDSIKLS